MINDGKKPTTNGQSFSNFDAKPSIWNVKQLLMQCVSCVRRIKNFIRSCFGFNSSITGYSNGRKQRRKSSLDYKSLLKSKITKAAAIAFYHLLNALNPLRDVIDEKDIVGIVRRPKVGVPQTLTKIAVTKASQKIKTKEIREAMLKLYKAVFPENTNLKEIPSFGILSKIREEVATLFKPSEITTTTEKRTKKFRSREDDQSSKDSYESYN